jgi:hypothetical protein
MFIVDCLSTSLKGPSMWNREQERTGVEGCEVRGIQLSMLAFKIEEEATSHGMWSTFRS